MVLEQSPHKLYRSDHMEEQKKYDATYKFGNSTVHVVSPTAMTKEEKDAVVKAMHIAGWAIIEKIDQEEKKFKKSGSV